MVACLMILSEHDYFYQEAKATHWLQKPSFTTYLLQCDFSFYSQC